MNGWVRLGALAVGACVLSGCWTFRETPPSAAAMTRAANADVSVEARGFAATEVDYVTVWGSQTYYDSGWDPYWHGTGMRTVNVSTTVPQVRRSDVYLQRARDLLEESGFLLGGAAAKYEVEVVFEGPFEAPGDGAASLAWPVGTLFFCNYAAQEWRAKMRIRLRGSGRLLMARVLETRFETHVASAVPILGISFADRTKPSFVQYRCLSELTERAMAEATAFLASAPTEPRLGMADDAPRAQPEQKE